MTNQKKNVFLLCSALCFSFLPISLAVKTRLLPKNSTNNQETNIEMFTHMCCSSKCNCWLHVNCVSKQSFRCVNYLGTLEDYADYLRTEKTINSPHIEEFLFSDIPLVPADIFRNVEFTLLSFLSSNITSIDDAAFRGVDAIRELSIVDNKLQKIPNLSWNEVANSLWKFTLSFTKIGVVNEKDLLNLTYVTSLDLSHNDIANIHPNAFASLKSLEHLDLTGNELTFLDDSVFRSNVNLRLLSLSANRLKTVGKSLDALTASLTTLCLSHNDILENLEYIFNKPATNVVHLQMNYVKPFNLSAAFTSKIPGITTLELNGAIAHVHKSAFDSVKMLNVLKLANNNINFLGADIFQSVYNLTDIHLDRNNLSTVDFLKSSKNILSLYINHNQIYDMVNLAKVMASLQKLRQVIMGDNSIVHFTRGIFTSINRYLSILDICYAWVQTIDREAFTEIQTIRILNMSGNLLSSLNGSLQPLNQLNVLDLSYNRFRTMDSSELQTLSQLRSIELQGNQILQIDGAFHQLSVLRTVNMSYNNLTHLTEDTFRKYGEVVNVQLKGNPLQCDCRMKWLIHSKTSVIVDNATCVGPEWLKNNSINDITESNVTIWKTNCPDDCDCTCKDSSRSFGVVVTCRRSTVPELLPDRTEKLVLKNVSLSKLPVNLTQFHWLKFLDLENNNIASIDGVTFPHSLEALYLTNNKINTVPSSLTERTSLKELRLAGNPMRCVCDERVLQFLNNPNMSTIITDPAGIKCADTDENGHFRNANLMSLKSADLCPNSSFVYAVGITIAAIGVVVILTVTIVYFRCGQTIKIWLYVHGVTFVKEDDIDDDKEFDAFISYSSVDEDFVVHQFFPVIERNFPNYNICVHYKHFIVGEYIHDNIFKAIDSSKRTVMVLTRNYLNSEWCHLEFKRAHQKLLKDRINRLIVIIMGELPPEDEIGEDIKTYLSSSTYLKWGDHYFWQRFQYAMPKPRNTVRGEEDSDQNSRKKC